MIPYKSIVSKQDLEEFLDSETFTRLFEFLKDLNDSVTDLSLRSPVAESEKIKFLVELLDQLQAEIQKYPPEENSKSRFGNPSFRRWLDSIEYTIQTALETVTNTEAAQELTGYLTSSFGDLKRIDYGTGHEANFLCFLYCLGQFGITEKSDYSALVIIVFWKYIELMRTLQCSYWLEPAGSHGVWGLDDYHFLPFLFGSAQLLNHKYIRPKSIHSEEIVQEFSKDYMYLACVKFINSVKTESLVWHSPMLNDISGVKSWKKVNEGMFKMYKAEVFSKLPIMQHFKFGSIIKGNGQKREQVSDEHVHVFAMGQQFPDCCGIRIPSAVAASSNGKVVLKSTGPQLTLPFD